MSISCLPTLLVLLFIINRIVILHVFYFTVPNVQSVFYRPYPIQIGFPQIYRVVTHHKLLQMMRFMLPVLLLNKNNCRILVNLQPLYSFLVAYFTIYVNRRPANNIHLALCVFDNFCFHSCCYSNSNPLFFQLISILETEPLKRWPTFQK